MDTPTGFVLPELHVPSWMNKTMKICLKTPGLQSLIGRYLGLITFTGRRSKRQITTPVTYYRDNERVLILTKATRSWWRNFATHPDVRLRLAGKTLAGSAEAITDQDAKLPLLNEFLKHRPRDAKGYGVELGPHNELDEETGRQLAPYLIPIVIHLS